MESSYVTVNFDKEMKKAVIDQLKKMRQVDSIENTADEGKLVIKVIAETKTHLKSIIVWKIQKMACINAVHILDDEKNSSAK